MIVHAACERCSRLPGHRRPTDTRLPFRSTLSAQTVLRQPPGLPIVTVTRFGNINRPARVSHQLGAPPDRPSSTKRPSSSCTVGAPSPLTAISLFLAHFECPPLFPVFPSLPPRFSCSPPVARGVRAAHGSSQSASPACFSSWLSHSASSPPFYLLQLYSSPPCRAPGSPSPTPNGASHPITGSEASLGFFTPPPTPPSPWSSAPRSLFHPAPF